MGSWDEVCAFTRTGIRAGEACYAVVYYADPRQNPKHPRYMQAREQPAWSTRPLEPIARHGQPEYAYTTRNVHSALWRLRTQDAAKFSRLVERAKDMLAFTEGLRERGHPVTEQDLAGLRDAVRKGEEQVAQDGSLDLRVTVLRGHYDDYGGLDLADGGEWRPDNLFRHTYFFVRTEVADALVEMVAKFKGDPEDVEATWVERLLLAAFYARVEVFSHDEVSLGTQFTTKEELRIQALLHKHHGRILREQRAWLKE